MFRNHLAAALRNLVRNKLYAAINIIGLAVGLAAALLIALCVREELTYDRWIRDHEHIYTVATSYAPMRGGDPWEVPYSYRDVATDLQSDFPEVEAAARESTGHRALGADSLF